MINCRERNVMGRNTQRIVGPAALEKERAGYDGDFYSGSQEQGRLVREGRWADVDREDVAEEIESLGREQFNKLESAFRVLLMHMLKWDHQPKKRSCSWALSIYALRLDPEDVLSDNPGLKPRITEAIAHIARHAPKPPKKPVLSFRRSWRLARLHLRTLPPARSTTNS
jgi:hypothetical protein